MEVVNWQVITEGEANYYREATFLKGAQSSRQALQILSLQIQKSKEGGQANNRSRARVLGKIIQVECKPNAKQNVKYKIYKPQLIKILCKPEKAHPKVTECYFVLDMHGGWGETFL